MGFAAKRVQYSADPKGGTVRVVHIPPAGRIFRPPAKTVMSMIPSQKTGSDSPT